MTLKEACQQRTDPKALSDDGLEPENSKQCSLTANMTSTPPTSRDLSILHQRRIPLRPPPSKTAIRCLLINDSSPESGRPVLQGGIFSMRSERPAH